MADMKNIELFDLYTGCTLNLLYENFPVCIDLDLPKEIKKITNTKHTDKELLVFSETLFWLEDSGYIKFEKPEKRAISLAGLQPFPYFTCTTLTTKGLSILKKIPDSIDNDKNIAQELKEAISNNLSSRISDIVNIALDIYS